MTALAASATSSAGSLRIAFSAAELAALEADVAEAQRVYDAAVGVLHGAPLDRRGDLLLAAEARLAAAMPYLEQTGEFRPGQILRVDDEIVRVQRVGELAIDVERGIDGSLAASHAAGVELVAVPAPALSHHTIEVLFGSAGAALEAGELVDVVVPFAGEIDRVRLAADQAGDAVIDILRAAFADPPGSGTSLVAAAKPELAAAARYDDETLEGWTRSLDAGDVLSVLVEDTAGLERLTVVLTVAL